MGRTVAAYSWQIEKVRERFRKFRQALRREDQKLFDGLMVFAKLHVQAGVMASSPNPADTVFLSILLEQQRLLVHHTVEIERLRHELRIRDGTSSSMLAVQASTPPDGELQSECQGGEPLP